MVNPLACIKSQRKDHLMWSSFFLTLRKSNWLHDFWKWIKGDSPFSVELEKVLCDVEDITLLMQALEKSPLE
jgi:hypothetical protein